MIKNMIKLKPMLLNEINIVNRQYFIDYVNHILQSKNITKLSNPEIYNWFTTHFLRWYISSENDNEKLKTVQKHIYKKEEPEWMSHNDVHDFKQFSNDQIQEIDHIIDFFLSLRKDELPKLKGLTFSKVRQLIQIWDRQLQKRMSSQIKNSTEGTDIKTIYSFPDGFKIVQFLSNQARKEEGDLMGHCIGGESYNNNENFSLRDPQGRPHATMEIRNNKIYQIKGKSNKPPIQKYIPYIVEFIRKNNLILIGDGENIGFYQWKGKYYDPQSKKWENLYKSEIIPLQNK